MACHAAKIATTNDYASFRKAHNGEQKVIANKAQNTFYSSNKNAIIYVIIASEFAFKFQWHCVAKLKPIFCKFAISALGTSPFVVR